ncbi:F-box only protein 42 [Agrilus planipennis]|uniref:F-box only protein 42 n=1 Tax=Agrilus planipennis TaxID=224129 RepID=A0A1W4X9Q1_AGRPL|nr:F-box only protein 42 [Agrilus planipennis]
MEANLCKKMCTVEDLPDEVLEFILSLIPPYKDLHQCMLVSKRWRKCVCNVTKTRIRNLYKAISDFDISWHSLTPMPMAPAITKRYSHVAAVHEDSMYVFGGCTCTMTTFNDLWRLDLSKRQWIRPLTMGTYPSPKACCSMVSYKNELVLFGGWTYPPAYPLHQSIHLFNELHTYDIPANRWTSINTEVSPPPTAGHSATVHGDIMVVFGGLQRANNVVHSIKSNDIWTLNLKTWTWHKQEVIGHVKPTERYGHSQTALDDKHILIMGGCGGPKFNYSDSWLLIMDGPLWKWKKVEIKNSNDAPPTLWCNPVCKVGDKIIVLSRCRTNSSLKFVYYSKGVWIPPVESVAEQNQRIDSANRTVDRDENVNGKRGLFRSKTENIGTQPQPGASHESGNNSSNNKKGQDQREAETDDLSNRSSLHCRRKIPEDKQKERLERLRRLEEKLRSQFSNCNGNGKPQPSEICVVPSPKKQKINVLGMYVLDISHVTDENPSVTWLPVKNDGAFTQGPEETILYTLVAGKSELIMFGGIQKEANGIACTTNLKNQVSNSLHFIGAPKHII